MSILQVSYTVVNRVFAVSEIYASVVHGKCTWRVPPGLSILDLYRMSSRRFQVISTKKKSQHEIYARYILSWGVVPCQISSPKYREADRISCSNGVAFSELNLPTPSLVLHPHLLLALL